jgi:phosphoribosyl 1,2-cyclic phosphodiesterase
MVFDIYLGHDGKNYRALLVDSNIDEGAGGIDLAEMLTDLLPEKKLCAFVNTHPHSDHLKGLDEIQEVVTIVNVWHSGFDPGKDYAADYKKLQDLITEVKKRGGAEVEIQGKGPLPRFNSSKALRHLSI